MVSSTASCVKRTLHGKCIQQSVSNPKHQKPRLLQSKFSSIAENCLDVKVGARKQHARVSLDKEKVIAAKL